MIRRPPVSTLTDTLVPDPTLFRSASDRLLLTAVDELCVTSRISPSTWSAMAGDWSEDQLLDLVLLVGTYTLIGMVVGGLDLPRRSEEHTSELQSLMRISYAVFCLKKKNYTNTPQAVLIHIRH